MTVNLNKNKAQILDAWKKVTENEDGYDWALFGYEGKSYDLKVESFGSGGLEQVIEEINEGKIQYVYLRFLDPNTKLVKFLLINFQGEAVLDLVHKGTCSNHIRDISRLLKNQLTITATTLDDLEEDIITKKLANITSAYNFQERVVHSDEKFVIGTNYSKVVPTKEIDSVKRDEFWKKEEEMEKARVAAELETKRLANLKLENERSKREQNDHQKRELFNKQQEVKKITTPVIIQPVSPIKPIEKDDSSRPRAEEMRMDRRKEAQELIGNRVNTAKAMFQQQAAYNSAPAPSGPPAKPVRKTIPKAEPEIAPKLQSEIAPEISPKMEPEIVAKIEPEIARIEPPKVETQPSAPVIVEKIPEPEPVYQPQQPDPTHDDDMGNDDDDQFSTIKRSPKTPTSPDKNDNNVFIVPTNDDANTRQPDNGKQQQQIEATTISTPVNVNELPESDQPMLKAFALYDYQAVDETEITFDPGDLITHIDQIDEGWWQGYSERFGTYGLFPANYVELLP